MDGQKDEQSFKIFNIQIWLEKFFSNKIWSNFFPMSLVYDIPLGRTPNPQHWPWPKPVKRAQLLLRDPTTLPELSLGRLRVLMSDPLPPEAAKSEVI